MSKHFSHSINRTSKALGHGAREGLGPFGKPPRPNPTRDALRHRAHRAGLQLYSDCRGGWMLVDPKINGTVTGSGFSLEQIALWLDDYEQLPE